MSISVSGLAWSTSWDMLQQAQVGGEHGNPCPGSLPGSTSPPASQGMGVCSPRALIPKEQGEREPGLQPAEGWQARARGASGQGEPRGAWQPSKGCAGVTHQFSICSSPSRAASSPAVLSTQQTRVWLQEPRRSPQAPSRSPARHGGTSHPVPSRSRWPPRGFTSASRAGWWSCPPGRSG